MKNKPEKLTTWRKIAQIYFAVANRGGKKLHFPMRGSSSIEIAYYLLDNHKQVLTQSEIVYLEAVMNGHT